MNGVRFGTKFFFRFRLVKFWNVLIELHALYSHELKPLPDFCLPVSLLLPAIYKCKFRSNASVWYRMNGMKTLNMHRCGMIGIFIERKTTSTNATNSIWVFSPQNRFFRVEKAHPHFHRINSRLFFEIFVSVKWISL